MTQGAGESGGSTTASMAAYADLRAGNKRIGSDPGLVLLYAPGFELLKPAYPLHGQQAMIGREAPAEVLIPQPAVSRSHARLSRDEHGWTIHDIGARNGTLVDGAFIQQQRLAHLSEVRVGDAFFKWVGNDCHAYLPYRIDGAVVNAPATPTGVVGGYQMACIASALERIALSPISIVVLGESGTGKEVFARQIHDWSGRHGAFCALNCAAIPPTLLESELFGYRRGAFSGADRDHVGLVRAADQGTLFLDEVGDLPLEAQAKLLRVLQTKEVLPLGATRPEQVDVRVVCATHRDLASMQVEGKFRRDLFARLNEYSVNLPPLRDRKEDVYGLCIEFLRQQKRPDLQLSVPYMTGLLHYDFPYNVRELEALIKRGIALADGPTLGAEHLSAEIQAKMEGYGRQAHNAAQRPTAPSHNLWPQGVAGGGVAPGRPVVHGAHVHGAHVHGEMAVTQPHSHGWPPATTPHGYAPPSGRERMATSDPATGFGNSYVAANPALDPTTQPSVPAYTPHPEPAPAAPVASPGEAELRGALQACGGNVAAVGRHFGKERMQVHRWMKRYGINPDHYRDKSS